MTYRDMHTAQRTDAIRDWMEDAMKGGTCKTVEDFLLVRESFHTKTVAAAKDASEAFMKLQEVSAGTLAPVGSLAP